MEIRYKNQQFQIDAANAVCDVFEGLRFSTSNHTIDSGVIQDNIYRNAPLISDLNNNNRILKNLQKIQLKNHIKPSPELVLGPDGGYNLSIEMETGVGKTFTYIKTMHKLNERYGWSKFIVVVPSIAIREGVYASFKSTQKFFGKNITFFLYNSLNLDDIRHFAYDAGINVMIINSQAFNVKDRRINTELDNFSSQKPIEVIAATNPILIIDEPQSVEGDKTVKWLKKFKPFLTLRYSATLKHEYNMVYRLDAIDAYNQKLVKKIAVKSVTSGTTATNGYVYLQEIKRSHNNPTATVEFEYKNSDGTVKSKTQKLLEGDDLYSKSNGLEEYKEGYIISKIDGKDNFIEFTNEKRVKIGEALGWIEEDQIRRIQIKETIRSHLERESQLYKDGIKVLSLFFIDQVAKYRQYDESNHKQNGIYADIFEKEYKKECENFISELKQSTPENDYIKYLEGITPEETHAGYFSIDKKSKRVINSTVDKEEGGSTDVDAYKLIMQDKEGLLDMKARPQVRFIFSHSALKEGWDNPNVFQICTLKTSNDGDKKRQEIGRGLRLCVNQDGERMDAIKLRDGNFHGINVLTVIANESYDSFTRELQKETAEAVASRPRKIDRDFFINQVLTSRNGEEKTITEDLADSIIYGLIKNNYIDDYGHLTSDYYEAKRTGEIKVLDELKGLEKDFMDLLDRLYIEISIENRNRSKLEVKTDNAKLHKKEFLELWKRINSKSIYKVEFDTAILIKNSVEKINQNLHIDPIYVKVIQGEQLEQIESKKQLKAGNAFTKVKERDPEEIAVAGGDATKYDLIGKIVDQTSLTRKSVAEILRRIDDDKFEMFKVNPEKFIAEVSKLINEQKSTVIEPIEKHITYNKLEESYPPAIITDPQESLSPNYTPSPKGLYNYLIYDSDIEKEFGEALERSDAVSLYIKLPRRFCIDTPVGSYNPDWAITFKEDKVIHIYFVAETKGSTSSEDLRPIEQAKIDCARKHFRAISADKVEYDVVNSYEDLLGKAKSKQRV